MILIFIVIPVSLANMQQFFHNENFKCPMSKLEEYLQTTKFRLENYRNSILVYNAQILINEGHYSWCRPLNQLVVKMILYNNNWKNDNSSFINTKYDHAIVFLKNLQSAAKVVSELLECPLVWTSDIKYHFLIISGSTILLTDLKATMKELWNPHRVLRYVIVYEDYFKNLQIIAYNPFENGKILNYSTTWHHNTTKLFPSDKIYNLNGFKVRISFENYLEPYTDFDKENCNVNSMVCSNFRFFFSYINATYEIIHRETGLETVFSEIKNKLKYKEIDLTLLSMWLSTEYKHYASYSITQWEIAVLVPKAKQIPMLLSMLFIFKFSVWIFILLLSLVFFCMRKAFTKIEALIGPRYLDNSLKLLLFCISIHTIVFQSAFQGAIITALTSPKYYDDINTIKDLVNSGLKIHGEADWEEMLNNKILPIKKMSYVDIATQLYNLKGNQAYLVTEQWKQTFLTNKTPLGDPFSKFYHHVKEPAGVGMITHYLQRNSPFKPVFNEFLLLLNDHGLNLEFGKKKVDLRQEKILKKLSLRHLHGAFLPLACGWVLSTLVFFGELWFHSNYRRT